MNNQYYQEEMKQLSIRKSKAYWDKQPKPVTAETLLRDLVFALDNAFISTWQSTTAWQEQLDAAKKYLEDK